MAAMTGSYDLSITGGGAGGFEDEEEEEDSEKNCGACITRGMSNCVKKVVSSWGEFCKLCMCVDFVCKAV